MITKKKFFFILPFILTILWGVYLHIKGNIIKGPFIFADEYTYFDFARSIFFGKSLSSFPQYGPLYPFLISPFFLLQKINQTYQSIRIFNIFIFLSTGIPAYLLARLLFSNIWLRILFPFCTIICAFSGLVYLVWAEPLYYALFYWTCFFFCLHIKKSSIVTSIVLGIFLALLYYTKPGSGIVIQIAAFLSLGFYVFFIEKCKRKAVDSFLISAVTCIALMFFWMMHYIGLGVSIIGYPAATKGFAERVMRDGYSSIILDTLLGMFYQFSYLLVGTWCLIGICFFIVLHSWKKLSNEERLLGLLLILSSLGLIALSALGMASFSVDYKMPQGRYYSVILPLIIVFTLNLLFKPQLITRQMKVFFMIIIALSLIISIFASPLYVRNPLAFNSMPDLSPFIYIDDRGLVIWRAVIQQPSLSLRIYVPLFFGFFALLVSVFCQHRLTILFAVTFIGFGMGFSAFAENELITACGFSEFHDLYFYLIKHNIDISKVAFDKSMESESIQFITKIWMNNSPQYLTMPEAFHLKKRSNIGFFVTQAVLDKHAIYSSRRYGTYKIYKLDNIKLG